MIQKLASNQTRYYMFNDTEYMMHNYTRKVISSTLFQNIYQIYLFEQPQEHRLVPLEIQVTPDLF